MILVKDLISSYTKEERQFHVNLTEPCIERGGSSTQHKGVLAQFLNTDIPSGRNLLCHACNNGKCSNPNHLYWGTDKENLEDAKLAGTWSSCWNRTVKKYGLEAAIERQRRGNKAAGGRAGKGRKQPEAQKQKTAETLRNKTLVKIKMVEASQIDFQKCGWIDKVAELLQIQPQKVKAWMKHHMVTFYNEKCFE